MPYMKKSLNNIQASLILFVILAITTMISAPTHTYADTSYGAKTLPLVTAMKAFCDEAMIDGAIKSVPVMNVCK